MVLCQTLREKMVLKCISYSCCMQYLCERFILGCICVKWPSACRYSPVLLTRGHPLVNSCAFGMFECSARVPPAKKRRTRAKSRNDTGIIKREMCNKLPRKQSWSTKVPDHEKSTSSSKAMRRKSHSGHRNIATEMDPRGCLDACPLDLLPSASF